MRTAIRSLLLTGLLFVGFAVPAISTNCWTNASGDGTWSNPANWTLGALPGDLDYVSLCSPTPNDVLTIDVEGGVTVGALITTNKVIRIAGEPLTLRGGCKGPIKSWGNTGYCGTEDVWSVFSRVPVVYECEVWLRPKGAVTIHAESASARIYFRNTVAYRPGTTSYNELNVNHKGSNDAGIWFYSTVDAPSARLCHQTQDAAGGACCHCYGKVRAASLDKAVWSGGYLYLYSPDNEIPGVWKMSYSGYFVPGGPNSFSKDAVVSMPGGNAWSQSAVNETDGFNLNNYAATINRLTCAYTSSWSGTPTQNQGNVFSDDLSRRSGSNPVYRAPTDFTFRGTGNGSSIVAIHDRVSIVWDPTGDYVQIFSNCTSRTSGDFTVKRGTLAVRGAAKLANLHAIDVAAGATFELDSSVAGSLAGLDRATVGAGGVFRIGATANNPFSGGYAVFQLAEGATVDTAAAVAIPVVQYAGSFVADGTYTSGNAAWVTGSGSVTVSSSGVAVWKAAHGGDWSESSNWLGGRIPDSTMKKVVLPSAGADYTVTLSQNVALPPRVEVRNAGAGTATLKVTSRVTHAGGLLSLDPGGRLELASGGTYDYSGAGTSYSAAEATPFRFVGGELLITGGFMCISNATGGVAIGGRNGATGRVRMTAGRFLYHTTCAVHPVVLGAGGEIALSGDAWFRCGAVDDSTGYKTVPVFGNEGGTLTATDSATFDLSLSTFSWLTEHPRGKTVFSGSSYFDATPGDYGRFNMTFNHTNRAEIVFRDHARMRANVGTSALNGVLRYESDGLSGSNGYEVAVGCASGARGELLFAGGGYGAESRGFFVGAATANKQGSVFDTVGFFRMTSGAFHVNGDDTKAWSGDNPNGVLVGYGARTSVRYGRPFVGTVELLGGAFEQNRGGLVVGAGYGTGDFLLDGGSYSYGGTMPVDVGLCGGLGRMVISNGTFKSYRKYAPYASLYVGGAPLSAVQPAGADFVAAGYPDFRHDADGRLTLAGGTVSIQGDTYVGADGDGVLAVVGSTGTFTTRSLVLSNAVAGAGTATARQTSATVTFRTDADGVAALKSTNLVITEGARLVVDMSDFKGACGTKFKLFDCTNRTGAFAPENVTLTRCKLIQVDGDPCIYVKADWAQGMMIIFRTGR